ncbi:MAG: peptidoglycan-binding protein [Proteobacteria bacterium]|nr:peptidoglycan-binding protein [Pseudomonadota bacterium]
MPDNQVSVQKQASESKNTQKSEGQATNASNSSAQNEQMTQDAAYDYSPLSAGSSETVRVIELQSRLDELGYDTNGVDGIYGSGTTGAVKAFQGDNGLPATGDADSVTLKVLYQKHTHRSTGALSEKFESPSGGIMAIGYDANGGTSYGRYQIASKVGTFATFVDFCKASAPDIASKFENSKPYNTGGTTGACPTMWKTIAESDPRLKTLEKNFITRDFFDGPIEQITDATCKNMILSYQTLKDVFWSTSVNHGQNIAATAMMWAYNAGISEEAFIANVYQWRKNRTANSQYKSSLWARYDTEKGLALEMISLEKSGAIPSTGLGTISMPQGGETQPKVESTQPEKAPDAGGSSNKTETKTTSEELIHTVVKGDSLWKIANDYGVEGGFTALAEYNGISVDAVIHVGDKIKIPGKTTTVEVPVETKKTETQTDTKPEPPEQTKPQPPSGGESSKLEGGSEGGSKNTETSGYIETSDASINAIQKQHPNGINVLFYGAVTKDSMGYSGYQNDSNNREFTAQANNGAKLGQTVGLDLSIGTANIANAYSSLKSLTMQLINTIKTRYQSAKPKDAPEYPEHLKIKDLSLYYHGYENGLNLPGEDMTKSNVADYVSSVRSGLRGDVGVQLFACSAANGEDSFAEKMAKELGDEGQVFGHTTAAHCTENINARVFNAQGQATNMVDVLFPDSWCQVEAKRIWGDNYSSGAYTALKGDLNTYYKRVCGDWNSSERKAFQNLYPETNGVGYYANYAIAGLLMFTEPEKMSAMMQQSWRIWALNNKKSSYSGYGTLASTFSDTSAEAVIESASTPKVEVPHSEPSAPKEAPQAEPPSSSGGGSATVTLTSDQISSAVSYNKKKNQSICTKIQKLVGSEPDGIFGPITVQAIANWQAAKSLEVDGKFGPKSKEQAEKDNWVWSSNVSQTVEGSDSGKSESKSESSSESSSESKSESNTTPPSPPSSSTPAILSDEAVQKAIKWTGDQGYTSDFIKQIEKTVGVAQDGKLDASDFQAIAAWQQAKGLDVDGKFGGKSIAAAGLSIPVECFKIPTQKQVRAGTSPYGPAGCSDRLKSVTLPYTMYSSGNAKSSIKVHKLIADRVYNIFKDALDYYGAEGIKKHHLDRFSGCYNNRNVKGTDRKSMHAWGIAIDIDGANNPNRVDTKGTDPLAQPEVGKFWDIVESYGGYSLGRHSNRDWMHFQFASWS